MFYLFFRVQKPHVIQSFQMTEQFRDKKEMQLLTVAVQTIPVLWSSLMETVEALLLYL